MAIAASMTSVARSTASLWALALRIAKERYPVTSNPTVKIARITALNFAFSFILPLSVSRNLPPIGV